MADVFYKVFEKEKFQYWYVPAGTARGSETVAIERAALQSVVLSKELGV